MSGNIIKYGLAPKGKPNEILCYSTDTNGDAEFCNTITATFETHNPFDPIWLVDTMESAEKARTTKPQWFNFSYDTPSHNSIKKIEELEVVKVELVISTVK